jgi:hypothetical protein
VFTGDFSVYEKITATIFVFMLATYAAGYFLEILLQNIAPTNELQNIQLIKSDERKETEITTIKQVGHIHSFYKDLEP